MEKWLISLKQMADYLSSDVLGGPRTLKLAWVINFQKAGTLPFVLALMMYYGNTTPHAWLYAALHGGYGLSWWIKDCVFPDPAWQRRVTWGAAVMSFVLVLGPYWILPWLLVSGCAPGLSALWQWMLVWLCWGVGLTLMLGADAQKHFVLKMRRGLITDGFFKRIRHPNYLGEILIYGSFAAWVNHWLAWAIVVAVWIFVFAPNIAAKERSLSRYDQWREYRQKSGLLWPRW